jgi:hypothetical protein
MKKVKNQEFFFELTKSQNSILLIFLIEIELPNKPESLNTELSVKIEFTQPPLLT